jgi:type I restriction enzyme S subunit
VHYFLGPDKEWAVDQHVTICRSSTPGITALLYFYLNSNKGQGRIEGLKTGATNMTMLNISSVRQFELIIPPIDLLRKFYDTLKPSFQLKKTLEDQNANLRRTRDLLLPRLVGGEVMVNGLGNG